MSKITYIIKEFTVCAKEDSDNLVINCKTYIAELLSNFNIIVDGTSYDNNTFHELYSQNIP